MLVLVLVVVLQLEGTRGELYLYHADRDDVVLPCNSPSSFPSCSNVTWSYNRDENTQQVWNEAAAQRSHRSSRLDVDSNCSLVIKDIDPDYAGLYTCKPGSGTSSEGRVYLNLLLIDLPQQNVFSTKDDLTLHCSLVRYSGLDPCPENSFRWLDETGTELTEGVRNEEREEEVCVSSLTVKRQSDNNRRFTCQFVEGNSMKVEAHYPHWFDTVNRRKPVHIYHTAGDVAVLPCNGPSSSGLCSSVNWIYEKNENMNNQQKVQRGIVQSSPRSARLSLDRNCSLIINNIMAEDAGRYHCQAQDESTYNTDLYLNLLIISSSLPAVDPTKNGDITLYCSLVKHSRLDSCPGKSLLWLDETGTEPTGEDDGYKSGGQTGCVSSLTVNLQSSRRFTCQFAEGNTVKIKAHYQAEGPPASSLSVIMLILKIAGLILMVGVTVGIIRTTGRKKPQKDINVCFAADDDTVNYENDERSADSALR